MRRRRWYSLVVSVVSVVSVAFLAQGCVFDPSGFGSLSNNSNDNQINANDNSNNNNNAVQPPECGDGVIDTSVGETCDDGNAVPGDGCAANCRTEGGWACTGEPSVCEVVCGDGIVLPGIEACDDGANSPNDGCSADCQVEAGYACSGEPSVCTATCGDGLVAQGTEGCDDGNVAANDGCGPDCQAEPGYVCFGEPSVCNFTCGNGTLDTGEVCDDGNTTSCDGCAADCSRPDNVCGDGYTECTEVCDDANTDPCDGCTPDCGRVDAQCGDGVQECLELCDDGNTDPCDGCAGDCSRADDVCGDNVLECGETCDDGNTTPCDGCTADCSRPDNVCGDGIRECTEPCEGMDFGAATCASETGGTLTNGTLTCSSTCTIDVSNCLGGCLNHSECPTGEQCIGSSCQAVGNTCGDSPFVLSASGSHTHTLANLTNDYNGGDTNGLNCAGLFVSETAGADRVYEIPMSAGDYITVWVTSQGGWNPVLYLSDACAITSCLYGRNAAHLDPAPERIDYIASASTTLYLVVDGDPGDGDFTLDVTRGSVGDWDNVNATNQVIFTEVMADPVGPNSDREWFEIYNTSATLARNLQGVTFSAPDDFFTISRPLMIEPQSYLVIAKNAEYAYNGGLAPVSWYYWWNSFDLYQNSACLIEIHDNGDNLVDDIEYNASWPFANAQSMYLCTNRLNDSDNDGSGNWMMTPTAAQYSYTDGTVTAYATPAAANPTPCP